MSSLNLDQVCLLIRTIEGINTSMTDTYCSSIISNNITGQVLLHCQVQELKSVLNMNFGDWELFKLVLNGMKEDEQSGPPRHQYHRHDDSHDHLSGLTRWLLGTQGRGDWTVRRSLGSPGLIIIEVLSHSLHPSVSTLHYGNQDRHHPRGLY